MGYPVLAWCNKSYPADLDGDNALIHLNYATLLYNMGGLVGAASGPRRGNRACLKLKGWAAFPFKGSYLFQLLQKLGTFGWGNSQSFGCN